MIVFTFIPCTILLPATDINHEFLLISNKETSPIKENSYKESDNSRDEITTAFFKKKEIANPTLKQYSQSQNNKVSEIKQPSKAISNFDRKINFESKHKKKPKLVVPRVKLPTLKAHVDLTRQIMTVFGKGNTFYKWPISSGRKGYETPTGTYKPTWIARRWYSRQYNGTPMPYSVFFNRGIATHGTNAVRHLGNPASHGCIRLSIVHARTFYNLVRRHGKNKTRIIVKGYANQKSIGKRFASH